MHGSRRPFVVGLLSATFCATVCGCFDSRWGEAKRVQQRNAAIATPSALQGGSGAADEPAPRAKRTFRIRFHATHAYTAQTLDWSRRVRELVDDANRILQTFDAALEIASMDAWSGAETTAGIDDSLVTALGALKTTDAGDDVDWVVGLVGGQARLSESFHEAGMAELLSKHIVVRATGSATEHDVIDKNFDELRDEDRARLRSQRRRHRTTAIFLHELGHTLGAVHEVDRHSLMYPEYRTDMTAFDEGASSWIAASLAHRTDHRVLDDRDAFAAAVLPALRSATHWVPRERDDMVARLETTHPGPPATSASASSASLPSPVAAPEPEDVAQLAADDRARFTHVLESKNSGDLTTAWTTGRPLFAKYPKVYSVQDLRCQLATTSGLAWTVARAECEPLMQLARDPKRVRK